MSARARSGECVGLGVRFAVGEVRAFCDDAAAFDENAADARIRARRARVYPAREREGAGQKLSVERSAHAVTTDLGMDLSAFAAKKAGMSARRTVPLMSSSVLTLPSERSRTASLKWGGVWWNTPWSVICL